MVRDLEFPKFLLNPWPGFSVKSSTHLPWDAYRLKLWIKAFWRTNHAYIIFKKMYPFWKKPNKQTSKHSYCIWYKVQCPLSFKLAELVMLTCSVSLVPTSRHPKSFKCPLEQRDEDIGASTSSLLAAIDLAECTLSNGGSQSKRAIEVKRSSGC